MSNSVTAYKFKVGQLVLLRRLSDAPESASPLPYYARVTGQYPDENFLPLYKVRIVNADDRRNPKTGLLSGELDDVRESWLRASHAFGPGDPVIVEPTVDEAKPSRAKVNGEPVVPAERPKPGTVRETSMTPTTVNEPGAVQDWVGHRLVPTYAVEIEGKDRYHIREKRLKSAPHVPA